MIRIVIPGTTRKNRHHRLAKGRVILSAEARRFRDGVKLICAAEEIEPITTGEWVLTMVAFWPRIRHLDVPVPFGDADAPVSAVLDALEYAGVLDDDARIVEVHARKEHDPDNPRIFVQLERVEDDEQEATD